MRNYSVSGRMRSGASCGTEASYRNPENPEYVVGMAYVPWQYFDQVYETDKALEIGTIFPELDKPFLAEGRGCRR